MSRVQNRTSRGFMIVPLAVVLWVALLILGVLLWQKTPPAGYVPAKGVGPGQIGSVILAVLYGGFWFWVVGGVAEKKGKAAANVTAVIAIGLAAVMMGLSYAGLTADQRKLAKNAQGAGANTQQTPGGSTGGGASNPGTPADQGMRRMADQLARQNQPGLGQPSLPTSRPGSVPPPRPQTGPAPARGPEERPATPPEPVKEHAAITPTVEAFEKEIEAAIEALIKKADAVVPSMSTMVAHDLRDVKKRLEDAEAMRVMSEGLVKRFDGAIDELKQRLVAAGVPDSESSHQSIRWAATSNSAMRGFAAKSYAELGERAVEELKALQEHFGKWTLNAKRELVCKDTALKQRLESMRFFVKAEADRHEATKQRLRGK
ncbi:MAG: hypothetical protein K2W85_05905 [Phycisphaerales bacterium]|nr:hypothetical protein [Phycisphaerales bacterium]